MKNIRAHVIIEGIVQGVFFRAHTQAEAQRRRVTGWVRNRHDGAVEAVFEGKKDDVQAVVTWCHTGPPHARVDDVTVTLEEYTGEYSGFSIGR